MLIIAIKTCIVSFITTGRGFIRARLVGQKGWSKDGFLGFLLCLILSQIACLSASAQSDSLQAPVFFQSTTDQLLQKKDNQVKEETVRIATQTDVPLRETPGIVSVITREEIESSGARDLIDLLRLVPGLDFCSDAQNVIGVGVRGNYGLEGKVLITIDGQMLNETSYGSYAFAQRMVLSNLEKIEIIRGPGSAVYGGFAGLAVINMITRTGKDSQDLIATHERGFANGISRTSSQLNLGKSYANGLSFNAAAGLSEANLSNRSQTTLSGQLINYKDSSQIKSCFINTGLQYKSLDIRYHFEDYRSAIIEYPGRIVFGGHYFNAKYSLPVTTRFTIIPQFQFTSHSPWSIEQVGDEDYGYNSRGYRYTGRVQSVYQPSNRFTLVSGLESFYDYAKIVNSYSDQLFNNGQSTLGFTSAALFNQATLKTKLVNLTAGFRIINHSAFGSALVPRLGLTKIIDRWHLKLLYSHAFKAPGLENLNANAELKPERFYVCEVETGYQLSPLVSLTANLFDIRIKNIIVYEPIDDFVDHYRNDNLSGSSGGEIALLAKYRRGFIRMNYSYYQGSNQEVAEYKVPHKPRIKLGMPTHKATLQAAHHIKRRLSAHANLLVFSSRYTYAFNSVEEMELVRLRPALQANTHLTYNQVFYKGLSCSIGVNNLFNSNYSIVQPHPGGDNPIPAQGRELALKITVALKE